MNDNTNNYLNNNQIRKMAYNTSVQSQSSYTGTQVNQ